MSNVLRPNRNAVAWLLSSTTNSPTAGSANGACQPPWLKASLGSSSGPPGACITPSRVRNVCTVSFMVMLTTRRRDSVRGSLAGRRSPSWLDELAQAFPAESGDARVERRGQHLPGDGLQASERAGEVPRIV